MIKKLHYIDKDFSSSGFRVVQDSWKDFQEKSREKSVDSPHFKGEKQSQTKQRKKNSRM